MKSWRAVSDCRGRASRRRGLLQVRAALVSALDLRYELRRYLQRCQSRADYRSGAVVAAPPGVPSLGNNQL